MIAHKLIQDTANLHGEIDLVRFAEVGAFMSHVFNSRNDQEPRPTSDLSGEELTSPDQSSATKPDQVDVLLAKASKAIEFLAARVSILEQSLTDKTELAAEHEQTAHQWQTIAIKLKAQAASDQDMMADLLAQAANGEARITMLEAAASEAGELSAAAQAQSTRLHNQVVAAFGRKSPVYSVLQAIPFQEAAE